MPEIFTEPLLFNEAFGELHVGRDAVANRFDSLCPDLDDLDIPQKHSQGILKFAEVMLPGLVLSNLQHSPLKMTMHGSSSSMLFIPLDGQEHIRVERRQLLWGRECGSLFLPKGGAPFEGTSSSMHFLMLILDIERLDTVARAMMGPVRQQILHGKLDHEQVIPDHGAAPPAEAMAKSIGACINLYWNHPSLLDRLGLQDIVYRQLVMLLYPEWRLAEEMRETQLKRSHTRRLIDHVCDTVLSDLSARFTLTGMATLGNMSVRSLQYAFQHRFGMSPGEWLREQRLTQARQRLLDGKVQTIAQLAQECGFGTASRFTALYKKRFGQTPSMVTPTYHRCSNT